MKFKYQFLDVIHLFWITFGVALYTFGFVNFNMANHLAEGGIAGITLILHALFGLNPAWLSLVINLPLFVLGAHVFGKKSLVLTIYGTFTMSLFIWFWQKFPIQLGLQNDMMLVAIIAGLFSGFGSGLIFRYGATSGGSDIIARVLEEKTDIKLGQTLLFIDVVVLSTSLVYIDLKHMLYTLIASFVYSQVITIVQNGGYTVRGMLIITKKSDEAANAILHQINRGVTYLRGKGAYTDQGFDVLYVVMNPNEVRDVKSLLSEIDPDAFISILNIDEVVSSDFKIRRKNYDK